jgi:hypothetical protein
MLRGITDRMVRPDRGYLGWFQFGPHGDGVGRRLGQLQVDPAPAGSATVDKLEEYGKVDPSGGWVPAEMTGQFRFAPGMPTDPAIAVAVNGVIGGVSEPFREERVNGQSKARGRPDKFAVVTPDTLFKKGANRLELFAVQSTGGQVRLRPLTLVE